MINPIGAAQALRALAQDRQTSRILRLSFPNEDGPEATLLANGLDALEGLSCDFQFNVEVLCHNARLALKDLQGKMVTLELVREDGSAHTASRSTTRPPRSCATTSWPTGRPRSAGPTR